MEAGGGYLEGVVVVWRGGEKKEEGEVGELGEVGGL